MSELSRLLLIATAVSAGYIGFVVLLEVAKRKYGFSPEITRRIVHIVSGISTILDFVLLPKIWFVMLISTSLVGIAISQARGWLTSVHRVSRRTFGEVFLPVGSLATFAITINHPSAFVPALLVMTFADSFAGITSNLLKQQRKTWLGSLVFLVTSATIFICFGYSPTKVVLVSFAATLVERISPLGSDNLTVPAVTSALLIL